MMRTAYIVNRKWKMAGLGLTIFYCLFSPFAVLHASSVQSGSSFLKIDTPARPPAMAGAYTASAGDLECLYYNPCRPAALGQRRLSLTPSQTHQGAKYEDAS